MRLAIALLIVAAAAIAFVRWLEPRFAFFPSRGESSTPEEFGIAFEPATIVTSDGERLRVWRLHAHAPRALVVYFHGNGGNLSVWAPILAGIARRGYDVIAVDYRGYGVSTGRPSERGLYRDVDATIEYASRTMSSSQPVVYWGRSLGATMAAYASTKRRPDGLILEAGFPDARALVRSSPPLALLSVASSYRFPTALYANAGRAPVLVMHGTADSVVPFELGRALSEQIAGAKRFVEIAGGDHNDVRPPDEQGYWRAVDGFIAQGPRS